MRVLHLFSNSKWTGPAEPTVNLCAALRDLGVDIVFACSPKAGSGFNKVAASAREKGLEPLDFLYLSKHRHPIQNVWDSFRLRRHLKTCPYDLIHCHLDNDHLIAIHAARGMGIPIVRSNHSGVGFPNDGFHRRLMRRTNALVEFSKCARSANCNHFGWEEDRALVVHGAIDTKRFNPMRALPDMRKKWGFSNSDFVLGIVARMQTHRHYDDLFQAFQKFREHCPEAKLVIVGRGTKQERVGYEPVRRLGLEGQVHFTGYLSGDDYVGALHAFDAGLFLTPGTDGACRAVREIMAMGKPMVVADRGMLAEIVEHQRHGLVTNGTPEQMEKALWMLYRQESLRLEMGRSSYDTAQTQYTLIKQADSLLEWYSRMVHKNG